MELCSKLQYFHTENGPFSEKNYHKKVIEYPFLWRNSEMEKRCLFTCKIVGIMNISYYPDEKEWLLAPSVFKVTGVEQRKRVTVVKLEFWRNVARSFQEFHEDAVLTLKGMKRSSH